MQLLGFIVSLVLDIRAHIPNQPNFGLEPGDTSFGSSPIRTIVAFLLTTAFLVALIWLAVRVVVGFL
jgi:hypothetical protein